MVKLVRGHSDFVENMPIWCQDYVDDLEHNRKALTGMVFDTFGCSASELAAILSNASALADDCEEDWTDRQL